MAREGEVHQKADAEAPAFCIWTFFRVLLGTKFIVALCLSKEQEVQDTVQEAIGEAIGETHHTQKIFFVNSTEFAAKKQFFSDFEENKTQRSNFLIFFPYWKVGSHVTPHLTYPKPSF